MATRAAGRPAKKIFHKIGEVCELTKTEPYVLRYWESEFPFLAPEKNRAGQRIYTDDDIQTVMAIKRLLYEEGYTTAGARRRLEKERDDRQEPPREADAEPAGARPDQGGGEASAARQAQEGSSRAASAPVDLVPVLRSVRSELVEIRRLLGGDAVESPVATPATEPPTRRRRR